LIAGISGQQAVIEWRCEFLALEQARQGFKVKDLCRNDLEPHAVMIRVKK
jgi:hypothetical protein